MPRAICIFWHTLDTASASIYIQQQNILKFCHRDSRHSCEPSLAPGDRWLAAKWRQDPLREGGGGDPGDKEKGLPSNNYFIYPLWIITRARDQLERDLELRPALMNRQILFIDIWFK